MIHFKVQFPRYYKDQLNIWYRIFYLSNTVTEDKFDDYCNYTKNWVNIKKLIHFYFYLNYQIVQFVILSPENQFLLLFKKETQWTILIPWKMLHYHFFLIPKSSTKVQITHNSSRGTACNCSEQMNWKINFTKNFQSKNIFIL